jgi:hypothetical protein
MFECEPYRAEFKRRVETIRRILDTGDPVVAGAAIDISRETRGLAILLLFASYENLITTLCRGLLEKAKSLRVGNRRLRPSIKQFAVFNIFESIKTSSEGKIWQEKGRQLIDCIFDSRNCTIDENKFPSDGSYMKKSQVSLFCTIFDLGDPGSILKEVWVRLDTIVSERNRIAHGSAVPEEIGRFYTSSEIRHLVNLWECRWCDFIDHVEIKASVRDFYRV